MKTYHGVRNSSEVLGDVKVTVRQTWGTCAKCQDLVPAGSDHKFEHFNASFSMCDAPITSKEMVESPLMKRNNLEPDDFEWGPGHRAGAYNLSLAILWDVLGEQPQRHMVKGFALHSIMALSKEEWYISEQDVKAYIHSTSPYHAVA